MWVTLVGKHMATLLKNKYSKKRIIKANNKICHTFRTIKKYNLDIYCTCKTLLVPDSWRTSEKKWHQYNMHRKEKLSAKYI
jgi:hypothetical protein